MVNYFNKDCWWLFPSLKSMSLFKGKKKVFLIVWKLPFYVSCLSFFFYLDILYFCRKIFSHFFFLNVFYCGKMKNVFISPCFTVQPGGAKYIHVGVQLGKPLSLVSSNHSSGYCVCFLLTRSVFSFWGAMAAHLTYPRMRGFDVFLSLKEKILALQCGVDGG